MKLDLIVQIESLDGMTAVNLSEPSEGDLKRVFDAYLITWNELKQIRASHKRQCDLNDKAWEKFREVEKELAQAKEVIEFYANAKEMIDSVCDNWGETVGYIPNEDDFEEADGWKVKHFGKRARAFLGRVGK